MLMERPRSWWVREIYARVGSRYLKHKRWAEVNESGVTWNHYRRFPQHWRLIPYCIIVHWSFLSLTGFRLLFKVFFFLILFLHHRYKNKTYLYTHQERCLSHKLLYINTIHRQWFGLDLWISTIVGYLMPNPIYIYIYIITVLVVTKSLCGFVSNQVQYNMESTQYLG